jgi:hypothetical protein
VTAPPGLPASGPRTVSSKQVIQQTSEVLRVGPVACGPHFWKQPDANAARSTAWLIASSLHDFATRLVTSGWFQSQNYTQSVTLTDRQRHTVKTEREREFVRA